jgi:uncharacterized protein
MEREFMTTIKRGILIFLTVIAIAFMGQDLLNSWNRPQIQSRLELYQTNLLLQASDLQSSDLKLATGQRALLGEQPLKEALKHYQETQQQAQKTLQKTRKSLAVQSTSSDTSKATSYRESVSQLERLIPELGLNIGLLQAKQDDLKAALATWNETEAAALKQPTLQPLAETAQVLIGLQNEPPQLLPSAEPILKKNLEGWFRNQALTRLYQLQQRQDMLDGLQAMQQTTAQKALVSLAIVGGIPFVGLILGVIILGVLAVQWLIQRKQSLLAVEGMTVWQTPWDGETIWQVLIFGFFLVGQLVIPVVFLGLQRIGLLSSTDMGEQGKAALILLNYGLLATGGLGVLYASLRPFLPLPVGWFQARLRSNWIAWGIGGYFAALPLVVVVSLVNQRIWQGQGGSNPILPIALDGKDPVAIAIFFLTATVAAPIFEEILFRGFLLPSLTRYFPIWGAIALSSFLFAIAHLSLSEVLPLTVLGMVLAFVYARSGNLLSSMLLHSLWNMGTLLSLVVLGKGGS